jgi:hypothetical protein
MRKYKITASIKKAVGILTNPTRRFETGSTFPSDQV